MNPCLTKNEVHVLFNRWFVFITPQVLRLMKVGYGLGALGEELLFTLFNNQNHTAMKSVKLLQPGFEKKIGQIYLFRLLLLLFPIMGFAQQWQMPYTSNALFEPQDEYIDLNASQRQILSQWRQAEGYLNDQPVKVAHISDAVANNRITLTLPGDTTLYSFVAKDYEEEASDHYMWYGELRGAYGYLTLIRRKEGIIGSIQTPSGYYSIFPLGLDYAAIIEEKYTSWEETQCGVDSEESAPEQAIDICDEGYNTCPAVIDVLAIVTDNALTFLQGRFPDVTVEVQPWGQFQLPLWPLALEWAYANCNRALANSDIPNKRFRFRTHLQNLSILTTQIDQDRINIAGNATVQGLRNQYRADLVVVLTKQNYPYRGSAYIGVNVNAAFAIVETDFISPPTNTLVHELAHLFGAHHNRSHNIEECNNCGADFDNCAHGWRFIDGLGINQRTILALTFPNTEGTVPPRVLNFSNPDVLINGTPSGTSNDNNAKVIRNAGCEIANYRSQPEWTAHLTAPNIVCRNALFFQACAHVIVPGTGFPGVGPYTYEWYLRRDFQSEEYIGDSFCETISDLEGNYLYLRVVIRSADQQVIHLSKVIEVREGSAPPCFIPLSGPSANDVAASVEQKEPVSVQLTPNPSSGIFTLTLNSNIDPVESPVFIAVYDQSGRAIQTIVSDFYDALNGVELHLDSYPAGVYFVKVAGSFKTINLKLLKQ